MRRGYRTWHSSRSRIFRSVARWATPSYSARGRTAIRSGCRSTRKRSSRRSAFRCREAPPATAIFFLPRLRIVRVLRESHRTIHGTIVAHQKSQGKSLVFSNQIGAGGGGRTHMLSEERGILSPVRLPVPPLQREFRRENFSNSTQPLSSDFSLWETCAFASVQNPQRSRIRY